MRENLKITFIASKQYSKSIFGNLMQNKASFITRFFSFSALFLALVMFRIPYLNKLPFVSLYYKSAFVTVHDCHAVFHGPEWSCLFS